MPRHRWRSRPAKKRNRRALFIALVIVFLFAVQTFLYIDRNLRPPLMSVAKVRVKQMATQAINTAITDRMSQGTHLDKLIDWRTDKNGKITGFMLNYVEHMKITSETIEMVQHVLDELTEVPERIPVGQAFGSPIFASFGPKVPIKLTPAGAVKVDLSTRQQEAGINMILVEVYVHITAEVAIIIPFDSEPEVVETEIPISYVLVVGDVPMYYYDSKGNPSGKTSAAPPSIAIPQINPSAGKTDAAQEEKAGGK